MFKFRREKKTSSGSDLADRMSEYLDCDCIVIMPGEDDGRLVKIYQEAAAKRDVFPVFVRVDAALMESLLLNSDPADAGEEEEETEIPDPIFSDSSDEDEEEAQGSSGDVPWKFNPVKIRAYREDKLTEDLPDGKGYFDELRREEKFTEQEEPDKQEKKETESREWPCAGRPERSEGRFHFLQNRLSEDNGAANGENGESEKNRKAGGDDVICRPELTLSDLKNLRSFWEFGTGLISEMILALIPVSDPWRIFAWLPFGGWNRCPDTEHMMAVSKYWYEKYGAVPIAVSHDELEFLLPRSLSRKQANEVSKEHALFCPDIVKPEGKLTEEQLSEFLNGSKCWYFWWD